MSAGRQGQASDPLADPGNFYALSPERTMTNLESEISKNGQYLASSMIISAQSFTVRHRMTSWPMKHPLPTKPAKRATKSLLLR